MDDVFDWHFTVFVANIPQISVVMPNQYCSIVVWEIEAGFRVILIHGPRLLFRRTYYDPFMTHCPISQILN